MREEKKKISRFFLPLLIVFLFVGSIFGVMIGGTSNDGNLVKYNGINFKKNPEGTFSFKINDIDYIVVNDPILSKEVLKDIPANFLSDFANANRIYLSRTQNESENALYLLYNDMNKHKKVAFSCFSDDGDMEQCEDLPLKDCGSVDEGAVIMEFKVSEKNSISYDNKCLKLEGSKFYTTSIAEAIILEYLGVYDEE